MAARAPLAAGSSGARLQITVPVSAADAALPAPNLTRTGSGTLLVETGPHPLDSVALATWMRTSCNGPAPVRQGFAAVLVEDDHRVTAAVSSRREIAFYYTISAGRLVGATRLGDLIELLPAPPALDVAKLADLMALHDDPATTVFAGIARLPLGHVLSWSPGRAPTVRRWFRPDDTEPLRLRPGGEVDLMRDAIREAVAESLPPAGDVAATLSGGLDSAMVVATAASLLHPRGRRVHTATHVPLPGTSDPNDRWQSDDGPYARAMAEQVPGLTWTPIVNHARTSPIEALLAMFPSAHSPSLNSANVVWIGASLEWAGARDLPLLLTGASGNATFSRGRSGVLRQLAGRRMVSSMLRQLGAEHRRGDSWSRAARGVAGQAAPPWLHRWYRRVRGPRDRDGASFGEMMPLRFEALSDAARDQLARFDEPTPPTRDDWVRFVLDDGMLATLPHAMSDAVWWSDPLSDPAVTTLALSLPPEAWIRDGDDRSLARRSGNGLIPDHIRLRTTRGAQAADVGQWLQGKEQVYRDAIDEVAASPAARQFIDVDALARSVAGGLPGPGLDAIRWDLTHGRALGFGLFAAWYERRARDHEPAASSAAAMTSATADTESTPTGRTTSTTGTADTS